MLDMIIYFLLNIFRIELMNNRTSFILTAYNNNSNNNKSPIAHKNREIFKYFKHGYL